MNEASFAGRFRIVKAYELALSAYITEESRKRGGDQYDMRVNGVFQGGGVKGIGLVGAVYAAERRGIRFHQTAGTSVGALVAALIAAGYSGEEMRKLLLETPFQRFIQKDWIHRLSLVGPTLRLLFKKGLYSGDPLEAWMTRVLANKGIRTFADLPRHAVRVVASDITQGKMLVLPDDIAQYGIDPNTLTVAGAVRMSTSLPFFFDPVTLRVRGQRLRGQSRNKMTALLQLRGQPVYIVDGAILSNYPLWIFDRDMKEWPQNIPTIGFQLVGAKEATPNAIFGPITMLSALFSTMSAAHDLRYIESHSRFRTIKIPSAMVHTTEFDIGEEKLTALFESGVKATDDFFSGWTYAGYTTDLDKHIDKLRPGLKAKTDTPKGASAHKDQ